MARWLLPLTLALLWTVARGADDLDPDNVVLDLGDRSYSGVWTVRSADGKVKTMAAVPGGVYSDLRHEGVLNESLYYRFNDVNYRWVSEMEWSFSRHFNVAKELLDRKVVLLVCDGIDTVSNISINGKQVGSTVNQFVRYTFDVKAALREGDNRIEVSLRSPSAYAAEKYAQQAQDYIVPPKCPPPQQHGVCHANHIRKMQASFSWDWGPAFPNAGIWRPIRLVGFDALRVADVMVDARPQSEGKVFGAWTVQVKLQLAAAGTVSVNYSLSIPGIGAQARGRFSADRTSSEVALDALSTRSLAAEDLWWPNGPLGAPTLQTLTLCLTLTSPMPRALPCRNVTFGLREVRLVQDPVDPADAAKGLTFFFRVNGAPVFAKGSNWIPADALTERVTPAYLRLLLTSARDANMNMLRVWGGGIYEDDTFYQLADELGLMVWQDMMFACAMYPADNAFLATVRQEVQTQLWRLQHHPSIVIWAGNNENEKALRQNWYGTKGDFDRYKADYVSLYVDTVRDELTKVLGSADAFVTSSPSNGRESDAEGYVAKDPGSSLYGDVHVYEYILDMWNTTVFPRPRFSSEYGLQSWPSLLSLAAVSEPHDLSYSSDFVAHRQHHPLGNAELLAEIKQHFQLPQDLDSAGGFEDLVYLSQINQALAIRSETEHYRRGRSELTDSGEGLTLGAMYWQLNDIWQAPTWASIEYGGRWKLLQYAARRFFAPLLASVYVTGSGNATEVIVYAVSDLAADIAGASLRVSVYDWDRFQPPTTEQLVTNLTIEAGAARRVWSAPLSDLVPDPGRRVARFALVDAAGVELAEPSDLYPTSFESVLLGIATVRVVAVSPARLDNRLTTDRLRVTLQADAPAPFVWLETPLAGRFSDNGFTMLEGARRGGVSWRRSRPTLSP
ncbi:LOW QUALITY PROTEIN: beta-mannosidase-like [Pollicipes pollicipes]|uniref:LOW QUALITY PROTEIN: beta-mannosidase-like n=1 Tax=Pollicipes pollicipes TaxID=41117 RepID=UPI0018851C27|nr:LOW QUALITY PROTEIN: beta-mannosidase-like [Pollicipes pollicipes]